MNGILDALGITGPNLEPGDLIASAVLLVRVIEEDGTEYVGHYSSDGLSFVEKVGMLRVAERMTMGPDPRLPRRHRRLMPRKRTRAENERLITECKRLIALLREDQKHLPDGI